MDIIIGREGIPPSLPSLPVTLSTVSVTIYSNTKIPIVNYSKAPFTRGF